MILMVKDLLLLPEFREFQLAAGEKGLDNRVTGTGIFEWESPEDIARDFRPGEFVVTTLSQMKEDPAGAEGVLLKLLEKRLPHPVLPQVEDGEGHGGRGEQAEDRGRRPAAGL